MQNYKSYLYIIPAIIFWGSAPAIVKLSLSNIDVFQITFFMFLLASIGLFLLIAMMGKLPTLKKYRLKDFIHFALMGFIGIFLYFQFLFHGFYHASAQEAYIINYTWPVWLILFTIILTKDKLQMKNILSLSISFIGLFIIITKGNILSFSLENSLGYIFALLSAICYALFSAIGKKEQKDPINAMFFYFLFSSIYAFIPLMMYSELPALSIKESTAITWLGLFSCALGFLFWFKALHHGNTSELVNIVFLTPFLSIFFIYIFIVEQIQITSIYGLILVLLAVIIDKMEIIYVNKTIEISRD